MTYISILKATLSPVLLMQGRWVKRTALRLPEPSGKRHGYIAHESGGHVLNLLFLGDSTMAGVGVTRQEEALASQTSLAVSTLLARSIHWKLIAKSGLKTSQLLALARKEDAFVADVLIMATGGNDALAQTKPRRFILAYEELIDGLLTKDGRRRSVINGLPPLHITPAIPQPLRWFFGICARQLDRRLKRWARTRPDVSYVSLQWAADRTRLAEDRFHPGQGQYREWSRRLARQIADDILAV